MTLVANSAVRFLSICNSGIHPKNLNSLTSRTIYNSVVIPKALYGCELWGNVSGCDLEKLERSHRFCLKYMQHLSQFTNNALTHSLIDVDNIETIIDYRKLIFFGQLCRLPPSCLAKQIFHQRLLRYLSNDRQRSGFIPDIYRILQKYNFLYLLDCYVVNGGFPTKVRWKTILFSNIVKPRQNQRVQLLAMHFSNFDTIRSVFDDSDSVSIWTIAKAKPELAPLCEKLVRVICCFMSHSFVQRCSSCNCLTYHLATHKLCFCIQAQRKRAVLWDTYIECCGADRFIALSQLNARSQCLELINTVMTYSTDGFVYLPLLIDVCRIALSF